MTDDAGRRGELAGGIVLFAVIFILIAVDLGTDYGSGVSGGHLAAELLVLVLSATGVVVLWRRLAEAREQVAALTFDVAAAQHDADRWRAEVDEHLGGVRDAIHRQFDRWNLTVAEREVARGLLRGLGHKEIARERRTSERTVRQQARVVYQKAALGGRSELAAFFLDAVLMSPAEKSETVDSPGRAS